jgi:polyhydroxyalkanoate synthase subunit PhaC
MQPALPNLRLMRLTIAMLSLFSLHSVLQNWKHKSPSLEALSAKIIADYADLSHGLALFSEIPQYKHRYQAERIAFGQFHHLYRYAMQGIPVLCVPSLINQAYILDFAPNNSLMHSLRQAGFAPYLLAWCSVKRGNPTLHDYLNNILLPTIQQISLRHGQPIILVGYCFGGVMAALAAALLGDVYIRQLSLLTTPWDFSVAPFSNMATIDCETWTDFHKDAPHVTAEFLQMLFYWRNIFVTHHKFQKLGRGHISLTDFTPLEQWATNGIAMSKAVFTDCLMHFIYSNQLVNNSYHYAGQTLDLQRITMPVLCMTASKDSVIPRASSHAVLQNIPHAQLCEVAGGHLALALRQKAEFIKKLAEMCTHSN